MMQHIGKVFNAALNKKKKNYATCIGCHFNGFENITMMWCQVISKTIIPFLNTVSARTTFFSPS